MWREAINSSVTSIFQSAFILALYTEDQTLHCEGAIFPVTIVCALFAFSNAFYLIVADDHWLVADDLLYTVL